jgi:SAM-dependent methyltransferase
VPDEPLSRRGLLSLRWARRTGASPAEVDAYATERLAHWQSGCEPLLAALAPLQRLVRDVVGEVDPVLDVDVDADAVEPLWTAAALPYPDVPFAGVVSRLGAALAPRPRAAVRQLLRLLDFGGTLALAAPAPGSFIGELLTMAGPSPEGVASPVAWSREQVAAARIQAEAPGADVEVRTVSFPLAFASEEAAWATCSTPLGLPPQARDAFAFLVASRSEALGSVRIAEQAAVVVAGT